MRVLMNHPELGVGADVMSRGLGRDCRGRRFDALHVSGLVTGAWVTSRGHPTSAISVAIIHLLYVVHGQDTSLRDASSTGRIVLRTHL